MPRKPGKNVRTACQHCSGIIIKRTKMDEYIVSARKYRPMTFDSVVGQSALTTTLKNAVKSGKLAHAYLFCGPRGVGKTTCARIFAKVINCEHPTAEGEACNECESCKAFNEQRSYGIFELDAASNNSVENIKQLMEQTRIPPQVGRYKVFIIDEVHMLSQAAFNAFLKTLEEPPAHVVFVLATTEKHKILPTILSRCQIYDFERMTIQGIINHLKMVARKEGISCEEEALSVIAEKADGGMRDALSIFDQAASFCQGDITYQKVIEDLNVLDADNYFRLIDLALENKVGDIMVLLNGIISKGFEGGNLINGLASHVRNVLMAADAQTLPLLEVSDRQRQKYQEQARRCNPAFLYKALKLMNQCDVNYRASSNKRLLVELTLIQIAQLTQPDDDEAGAGRSPKRLKSLFKHLLISQPKAAAQVAVAEKPVQRQAKAAQQRKENVMPSIVSEPAPETTGYGSPSAGRALAKSDLKPVASDSSPVASDMSPAVSDLKPSAPSAKPKLKLSGIGMTFKDLRRQPKTSDSASEEKNDEVVLDARSAAFTQQDVELQWRMMCNRMPPEMRGMASRMKNMQPRITEYPAIEVLVDNQILLNQVKDIRNRIRVTLAKGLGNGNVTIDLRLAKHEEVKRILTKREMFDELRQSNPAIEKLRDALKLELS